MSKGAGSIERKLKSIFERAPKFVRTTGALCQEVYGIKKVHKKHRVAVLRALKTLARRRASGGGPSATNETMFGMTTAISHGVPRMKRLRPNGAALASNRLSACQCRGAILPAFICRVTLVVQEAGCLDF